MKRRFIFLIFLALPLMSWGQKAKQVREFLGTDRYEKQYPTKGAKVVFRFTDTQYSMEADGNKSYGGLLKAHPGFKDSGGNLLYITINGKEILGETEKKDRFGVGDSLSDIEIQIANEKVISEKIQEKNKVAQKNKEKLEQIKKKNAEQLKIFSDLVSKLPDTTEIKEVSGQLMQDVVSNEPIMKAIIREVTEFLIFVFIIIFFISLPFGALLFYFHRSSNNELLKDYFGNAFQDKFLIISRKYGYWFYWFCNAFYTIIFILLYFLIYSSGAKGTYLYLFVYVILGIWGMLKLMDWAIRNTRANMRGIPDNIKNSKS